MKKHLSVIGLFCRSTVLKLLAVSAAAIAAELLLFIKTKNGSANTILELIFKDSGILWVFGLWFVLVSVILCMPGCDFKSRSGYTFRRLQIKESTVFVWQSVYNVLCFVIMLTLQILAAYAMCMIYMHTAPGYMVNEQTVFLAFYRSDFLHSILPLEEGMRWSVNAMALLSMGICTAYFPFMHRRGRFAMSTVVTAVTVMTFFIREMGYFGILPFAVIITAGVALFNVFTWEDEDEENENGISA